MTTLNFILAPPGPNEQRNWTAGSSRPLLLPHLQHLQPPASQSLPWANYRLPSFPIPIPSSTPLRHSQPKPSDMSPTVAPLSAENHAPSTACPGLIFYYLWAKRTNVETETVLDGMNSHHFLHHCLFFPVDWKTKGLVPLNLTLGGQTILSRRCQLNPAAGDGRLCLCQAAVFSSAILLFLADLCASFA